MYPLLRRLLFKLEAERAHDATLRLLDGLTPFGLGGALTGRRVEAPVQCLGLTFPNAVGLAAGLDKNADHLVALGQLGFGFVEVGTVTPRPQPGNARPRVFRLPEEEALINRLGFNNKGVDHAAGRVRVSDFPGVLGVNIGKNRDTPAERAVGDYLFCLQRAYTVADYIVVNVSSPNTPGLRDFQHGSQLDALLSALKAEQQALSGEHGRYVPLVLKVAPDLAEDDLDDIVRALREHEIEGVTATNTTLDRSVLGSCTQALEAGGLSGAPLLRRSTEVLRGLRERLGPTYPIIGVGGVLSGADALQKRRAGADLVQLYTGLIYRGPRLIADCARALADANG